MDLGKIEFYIVLLAIVTLALIYNKAGVAILGSITTSIDSVINTATGRAANGVGGFAKPF